MLENLLQLVKEHSGQAIVNNAAIPNEHNDAAISTVSSSIFDSLKKQVAGGNISDVMSLLSGNANTSNHPVLNNISKDAISNLTSQFGISNAQAGSIVSSMLPAVITKLVHKTNDANDNSFDLKGIFGSLTGNSNFDVGGILNKVTGSNKGGIGGILGKVFGG